MQIVLAKSQNHDIVTPSHRDPGLRNAPWNTESPMRPRPLCWLVVVFATFTFATDHKPKPLPQQVFAPYWTAEPGWHSEFQLRNSQSSAPLVVRSEEHTSELQS